MTEKRCVFDVETSYTDPYLGRKGSPFAPIELIGLCSSGFKLPDGYKAHYLVTEDPEDGVRRGIARNTKEWLESFPNLDGVDLLIGHNMKFDLLWYWRHPELEKFLKRGGEVWDTQYAEYLLSGQFYAIDQLPHLRPSLDNVAKRRGCTLKLDVVKALWENGVRTEDIQEQILMEYLEGDCITTDEIYVDQLAQAGRQNQLHMIKQRMEGLLATTEMEFNGLLIDREEGERRLAELEEQYEAKLAGLGKYIPDLPEYAEFKWGSPGQLSALIFGGYIKYQAPAIKYNEDGTPQYYKKTVKETVRDDNGNPVVFKSGKNKGKIKTRNISVPDVDRGPKTRLEDFYFELPRQAKPKDKWECSTKGQWSTAEDVLKEVEKQGVELVKVLLETRALGKDIGTYYRRFHKGRWTGMLTLVHGDGLIHHSLNHTITKTTRLSCSKPNLQNLTKKGKSQVRKMFISRFGADGVMVEGDYGQLEVVCKGVLSGDKALLQSLINGVDWHCDWLAASPAGEGKSYEEIVYLCKVVKDPIWVEKRQKIKPLTFGEQYGAGVASLAEDTGMLAEDVKAAIENRKAKYTKVYVYDDDNIAKVEASRKVSPVRTPNGMQAGIGYLRSATDTIFHFIEGDSPDWMQKRGTLTSFTPTTIKNYPSQGLGGEIMEVQAGRIFRWILANDRFDDKILMVNTVHDSIWFDCHRAYLHHMAEARVILEDVCSWFNKHFPNVNWDTPFPVDFDYGPTMYDLKALEFDEAA